MKIDLESKTPGKRPLKFWYIVTHKSFEGGPYSTLEIAKSQVARQILGLVRWP